MHNKICYPRGSVIIKTTPQRDPLHGRPWMRRGNTPGAVAKPMTDVGVLDRSGGRLRLADRVVACSSRAMRAWSAGLIEKIP
jgi:hypothetical protein